MNVPPVIPNPYNRMYRSSDAGAFGGVCAGLAHRYGLPEAGLRVAFIFVSLFFLAGAIIYVALWLALPKLPTSSVSTSPPYVRR